MHIKSKPAIIGLLFCCSLKLLCLGQRMDQPLKVYVLDVDSNLTGEFSSVGPALTEAIQSAFSSRSGTFHVLERRHLEQIVKANQLERDLETLVHGGTPSSEFVKLVPASSFVRSELVDGSDGAVLTISIVELNSEIVWQGQAQETRAGWLIHANQFRDASKLAQDAEAAFRGIAISGSPSSRVALNAKSETPLGQARIPGQPAVASATLETGSYRLRVTSAKKDGNHLALSLTAESKSDQPIRFVVQTISCYLLDEDGNRWNQQDPDSAGFSWSGVELEPGTKVKSNFVFVAKGASTGHEFSFHCPEGSPQQGRHIQINGFTAQ
jgi:hypothetical protein